jgi:hypothetical protein
MPGKPNVRVGETPQRQTAAETPRTSAPGVQHQFFGAYGYWLGDSERRYGRLRLARSLPTPTKLEMLRDPVIALAMGFIGATLVKAKRVVECTDESKRRFFEAMFRAWEREFTLQAAMAVALGSCGLIKRFAFEVPQPQEIGADPVWTSAAMPYVVKGFDAAYPVGSSARFGPKGRHFRGMDTPDGPVDEFYSLWLTLGQARAFGAYNGSGRLENVYKHWWLKNFSTDLYLVFLQKNINPAAKVKYPPGVTKDGKSHQEIAKETGDSVRSGATVAMPSTLYTTMSSTAAGEERLSAVPQWAIDFLETNADVGRFHEVEDQCDAKIALGMLIPPQAFLNVKQSALGGPTTSDVLSRLAEELLLMDAADIDRHVNDYVFPAVERANFPPNSPRVRVRTVGLEPENREDLVKIVDSLLGRLDVSPDAFDLPEALRRLGMPVAGGEEEKEKQVGGGMAATDQGSGVSREVLERIASDELPPLPTQIETPSDAEIRRLMRRLRELLPEMFVEEA